MDKHFLWPKVFAKIKSHIRMARGDNLARKSEGSKYSDSNARLMMLLLEFHSLSNLLGHSLMGLLPIDLTSELKGDGAHVCPFSPSKYFTVFCLSLFNSFSVFFSLFPSSVSFHPSLFFFLFFDYWIRINTPLGIVMGTEDLSMDWILFSKPSRLGGFPLFLLLICFFWISHWSLFLFNFFSHRNDLSLLLSKSHCQNWAQTPSFSQTNYSNRPAIHEVVHLWPHLPVSPLYPCDQTQAFPCPPLDYPL